MSSINQKELKKLLHYNPDTGIFTWKVKTSLRNSVGGRAGYTNTIGYRLVSINYKKILEHRLVWLYMRGYWPEHVIDHINGIKDDNR